MRLECKPVPGFEDRYYLDPSIMRVVNLKTGRPLKPYPDGAGYPNVSLWRNNHGVHKTMHRLFAEAYIPNPHNYPDINHKDEDITNFNLDNLEWCTQSYNQRYGTANERRGLKISAALKGKPRSWVAELKSKPVVAINGWGDEIYFSSGREAARELDLDQSSIVKVLTGKRRIAGGYRFEYAE